MSPGLDGPINDAAEEAEQDQLDIDSRKDLTIHGSAKRSMNYFQPSQLKWEN